MKDKKLTDILLEQGKVKPEVASSWKTLSNLEVENKVLGENLVSADDLARAYAALFGLPFVMLKERQIPKEALNLLPKNLAATYKIICYERLKIGAQETIRIAVAEPANLSGNLETVLRNLEQQKNYKIELGITTKDDFNAALSQYGGQSPFPSAPTKAIDLDKLEIPFEVISKFPQDIARKYQMVVFEAPHSSFIKVAVVDPNDKKVRDILDFIKTKNDIAIEEYKVGPGEIVRAMKFYEPPEMKIEAPPATSPPKIEPLPPPPKIEEPPSKVEPQGKIEPAKEEPPASPEKPPQEIPEIKGKVGPVLAITQDSDLDKFLGVDIREAKDLEEIAKSGNVPKIVAATIVLAVLKKASDIHIEPGEKNVRVRFRIDGLLRDIIKLPSDAHPAIVSRVKILSKLKIDESRIPQDGRFDVTATGHAIDLRISTLPTIHGEKLAMRILDKSAHLYTLEELGLTGRNLKVLLANMDKPYGVILSTGPTGSGKTTTLYAILNRISNASVNIITLEDPVEYDIGGINQCQIKPKIGFSFANGLRSVLRQDPNIIMVGEIRDSETASLATHAALTGHLVLSTLHTNDAAGALPRLIDMGVEPFFLTSLINAIIAQRLVRKLCPKCKRPAHIPEPIIKEIEAELTPFNLPKPYRFFEGAGCPECELGYKGRLGIFEVLTMSLKMEELILERKSTSTIKTQAIAEGMVTMKQDGLLKALKALTTVNEVMRVITV